LDGYEVRPGQIDMAHEVVRAFNEDKVAALEAGTGVGKSMAYLVPSLQWVLGNKERVVVSTNTINLQEQLIGKDIPFLGRVFEGTFKAVLVKGRGNYLCLRKLDVAMGEGDFLLEDAEKEELSAIAAWAGNTKEGSRSDINFMPRDDLWEKLNSESDSCSRLKCRHFTHCFFFRARREAASADLLVVNHHILLADIALRSMTGGSSEMAILPGYSRLIIDEGHNLEDGATSYFGTRVSRLGILKTLGRLHQKRDKERGALPYLASKLGIKKGRGIAQADEWKRTINETILAGKETTVKSVGEAFDMLYFYAGQAGKKGTAEIKARLTDEFRSKPGWAEVEQSFADLCEDLGRLARSINSLCESIGEDEGWADRLADPLVELRAQADRLAGTASALDGLLKGRDDGIVRWVEAPARKAGRVISLCGSPLNVAQEIKERIYDRLKTVVITSATLTVKKRFEYIDKRLGLDLLPPDRLITGVFPSPFDYRTQVIIGIPKDIPNPTDKAFGDALTGLVRESLTASRGRAFVLFTSFRMLHQVYDALEPELSAMGIQGMKQGDFPRHRLLQNFREYGSAALFGTDSFWEGVDVMGDALSNVIITKLPFSVPDDPVVEARQEEITAAGGNAFMEYIVPQAVIKFRQGFGRLIRSRTDRGSIMVFDRRIVEKNYGREFLASLPEGRVVTGTREVVMGQVRGFFAEAVAPET
ncbi:MAG: helicase, partial [Nitrospirae bacterium]|nr:helicase [Nitrospirota bacterium]